MVSHFDGDMQERRTAVAEFYDLLGSKRRSEFCVDVARKEAEEQLVKGAMYLLFLAHYEDVQDDVAISGRTHDIVSMIEEMQHSGLQFDDQALFMLSVEKLIEATKESNL